MDNHDKLVLAALGKLPSGQTLREVARDYSLRISNAIDPVTPATAPIIVSLLTDYAEEIKATYPEHDIEGMAKRISAMPKETVRMDVPRNARGRRW